MNGTLASFHVSLIIYLVPGCLRKLKLSMSRTEFLFPSPKSCSSPRLPHLPSDTDSIQKGECHPACLLHPLPSPAPHGQLITKTCCVELSLKMASNHPSPPCKGMLTSRQEVELNHMQKNEVRPLPHSIYTASWTSRG